MGKWENATDTLKKSLPKDMFDKLVVGQIVTFMPEGSRVDYKIKRIKNGNIWIKAVQTFSEDEVNIVDKNGKIVTPTGTGVFGDNIKTT